MHTDRRATHAISSIINVDQGVMDAPWHLQIKDHQGKLHEVELSPGEMLFYESARLLHGRVKPLKGTYYANFFLHFRPKGAGDNWYKLQPKAEV